MSKIKALIASTDPSFLPQVPKSMSMSDMEISAEWDMRYESFRDEEEAKAAATSFGVNQEVGNANSALPNQQQEPGLTK